MIKSIYAGLREGKWRWGKHFSFSMGFVLVLMICFLFSCKKEEKMQPPYRLFPEDITWNIYHVGDTIKFKSNYNHYRTYYVDFINRVVHNPNYDDNWISYEGIGIGFNRLNPIFNTNYFSMGIYRGYPGDPYKGFLILIGWHDGLGLPEIFNIPRTSNVDTLTVNNILYHTVYRIDNQMNNAADSTAKSLYYEKQKGWLQIELNSGEVLKRIN